MFSSLFAPRTAPVSPDAPRDSVHPGWPESTPTVLCHGARVRLRPLHRRDFRDWSQMRLLDEPFLKPVEPTMPVTWEKAHDKAAWNSHYLLLRQAARLGEVLPFAIEVDGRFAGQLTLGAIQHGSNKDCWVGYWVFSEYHGLGIATAACALGVDHAFGRVGLHRVTATYLPDNPASGKVLRKCGFQQEGILRRNLHIDGAWRDHFLMALCRDDFPASTVKRLAMAGRLRLLREA